MIDKMKRKIKRKETEAYERDTTKSENSQGVEGSAGGRGNG